MIARNLESGLRDARVLVCAGTGGVGKTTIAAALAIQAALLGRRTLVLTIDPARRLADTLGLDFVDSRPGKVDLSRIAADRSESVDGSLDAMMLETKSTFDRLVTRLTDDDDERRRILDNRIYEHLSSALAGTAEYAAMEQVHELVHSRRYDLIVVDTPPADHALDFLRAPRRLREFLESRFVKTLVRPAMSASRIGLRLFGRPLHRLFSLLERVAGVGFLDDLSEFLSAIDGLSAGFRNRATRVEEVLTSDDTGFVLISAPNVGRDTSVTEFMAELEEFRVPLIALVVNRMRPWPAGPSPADLCKRGSGEAIGRDVDRLAEALFAVRENSTKPADSIIEATAISDEILRAAQICEGERATLEALAAIAARARLSCLPVPELSGDIDRMDGLIEIGSILLNEASLSTPKSTA